jgi:hypothetical protein
MKMAVFWVGMSLQRFTGLYYLHHQGDDDAGSIDLWNVRKPIPVYTELQPRRQPSSFSELVFIFLFFMCFNANVYREETFFTRT